MSHIRAVCFLCTFITFLLSLHQVFNEQQKYAENARLASLCSDVVKLVDESQMIKFLEVEVQPDDFVVVVSPPTTAEAAMLDQTKLGTVKFYLFQDFPCIKSKWFQFLKSALINTSYLSKIQVKLLGNMNEDLLMVLYLPALNVDTTVNVMPLTDEAAHDICRATGFVTCKTMFNGVEHSLYPFNALWALFIQHIRRDLADENFTPSLDLTDLSTISFGGHEQ